MPDPNSLEYLAQQHKDPSIKKVLVGISKQIDDYLESDPTVDSELVLLSLLELMQMSMVKWYLHARVSNEFEEVNRVATNMLDTFRDGFIENQIGAEQFIDKQQNRQ